jgi:HSP20 family protein
MTMAMLVRRNNLWRTADLYNEVAQERARENASAYRLAVDAYETDDALVINASVPGMNPENIHINLEDEVLTIEGGFNNSVADVKYLLRERAAEGHFRRSLRLNIPVVTDQIEAVFDNGILTLTLPKAPEARPLNIPVRKID